MLVDLSLTLYIIGVLKSHREGYGSTIYRVNFSLRNHTHESVARSESQFAQSVAGDFLFNYYTIFIHDSSKLKIIAEALAEQRQLLCGETACSRCSTHSTRYIRHTIRYLGTACGIFDEVAELLLTGSLMVRSNSSGARD